MNSAACAPRRSSPAKPPGSARMPAPLARAAVRPQTPMTLEEIRALVQPDLASVDGVIRARLKSAVPLVDQIAEHIIAGGGKRLRPLLVVLAARACGAAGPAARRGGRLHRVHPHRHPAARRRGRRVLAAPRPRHRQRGVRQPGERAGRGLRLLARLPDDGGARAASR